MRGINVTSSLDRLDSTRESLSNSSKFTFSPTKETSNESSFIDQECVADQRPYRVAIIITAVIALLIEVYILICVFLRR